MNNDVRTAFKNMDAKKLQAYHKYWGSLTAHSNSEYFKRFLFAFCSVHTSWKGNVYGYEAIKDFHPLQWSKQKLWSALAGSGCGMHNGRTENIWKFGCEFWDDPQKFRPMPGEPLYFLRNRLVPAIRGLGVAKVSFALEMAYPTDRSLDIACLDVHMLRLYGNAKLSATSAKGRNEYERFEADWIGRCSSLPTGPYVARMVYWDSIQDKDSSRYWSYVLERNNDQQEADEGDGGRMAGGLPGTSPSAPDDSGHEAKAHTEGRAQDEELHRRENNKNEGNV